MDSDARARHVLETMEVPANGGRHTSVFVIGSCSQRVTLYTQQVRALNLLWALHKLKRLGESTSILIVGGGAAGLTAAGAAACLGASVTLLERQPVVMHLQQGNDTRWVHPHIYDWPLAEPTQAQAGLPILDWQAGTAGDVAEQLLREWERTARAFERQINVFTSVKSWAPTEGLRVAWTGQPLAPGEHTAAAGAKTEERTFDLIVLAVGFGIEPSVSITTSYWRNDSLGQPEIGERQKRYFVSGCGDGGLIDCLRLSLTRFRHDALIQEFFDSPSTTGLVRDLRDIERRVRSGEHVDLNVAYDELDGIDERLAHRKRRDTRVTISSMASESMWVSSATSALNRFLAFRLVKMRHVTYEKHALNASSLAPGDDGLYHINGSPYEAVVIRHNARPSAIEQLASFWPGIAELIARRRGPDLSRDVAYPREFAVALRHVSERAHRPGQFRPLDELLIPTNPQVAETSVIRSSQRGNVYLLEMLGRMMPGGRVLHASISKPLDASTRAFVHDDFTAAVEAAIERGVRYKYLANFKDPAREARARHFRRRYAEGHQHKCDLRRVASDDVFGINFFVFADAVSDGGDEVVFIPEADQPNGQIRFITSRHSEIVDAFMRYFESLYSLAAPLT